MCTYYLVNTAHVIPLLGDEGYFLANEKPTLAVNAKLKYTTGSFGLACCTNTRVSSLYIKRDPRNAALWEQTARYAGEKRDTDHVKPTGWVLVREVIPNQNRYATVKSGAVFELPGH